MNPVHLLFGAKPWFFATAMKGSKRSTRGKYASWHARPPKRPRLLGEEVALAFCGQVDAHAAQRDIRLHAVTTVSLVTCDRCRVFLDAWLETGKAFVDRDGNARLTFTPDALDAQRMAWQADEAWLHLPRAYEAREVAA